MEQGTRAKLVETYKEGTRVFAEALEGITDGELDARPGPDEWTAREVVHHMADSEMTAAIRLRRLIAEDAPRPAHYSTNEHAPSGRLILIAVDQEHIRPVEGRAALRAARTEWSRRQSVHVADTLAWALYANGHYRKASALSAEALRLGTRDALFLFHAGMIRRRLGDEPGARSLLQEAFDVNPYFSVRWSPVLRDTLARLGKSETV